MKKIEAIIRPERLQEAQDALADLAGSGLTGTERTGCGRQKAYTQRSRAQRGTISRLATASAAPVLKEVHSCEVAGRTLEAANVHALGAKVEGVLAQLAPGGALPVCYFRAPAMDYELPVYEERGDFVSPVIGGPNLRGDDLAGIRRHICRYLVNAGYVAEANEVTVGVLRPSDLRQVPPAAIFRSVGESDLWMPAVEGTSPDGPVVGVVGQPTRLRGRERRLPVPGPRTPEGPPAAPDAVRLLRYLCTDLLRGPPIPAAPGLYACQLPP